MAHRFHCEHCGKRLQADRLPGETVMCPHCRNTQIVPADATHVSPPDRATQLEPAGPAEAPHDGGLVALAAAYIPSWGTSVVLHLAVILVALMATWMTIQPTRSPETYADFERRAPKIQAPTYRPQGAVTPYKQTVDNVQPVFYKPEHNPNPAEMAGPGKVRTDLIGMDGGDAGGPDGDGIGIKGFRTPTSGPEGPIFRLTPARKIVFVIDRSGSMTDSIMYVKHELRRYISGLDPRQQFYVIFYSTGPAVAMPTGRLVPATIANRESAFQFIDDIIPIGGTDPSEALKAAFALRPEVIHLLSDGEFDQKVVAQVDKLNASKAVQVNTVCFIYPVGERILQEIARRNSGEYRYVSDDDLEKISSR